MLKGRLWTNPLNYRHHFPRRAITEEFLLVDLINNLDELAEDRDKLQASAREKALGMDSTRLRRTVQEFASVSTKKFFAGFLND